MPERATLNGLRHKVFFMLSCTGFLMANDLSLQPLNGRGVYF